MSHPLLLLVQMCLLKKSCSKPLLYSRFLRLCDCLTLTQVDCPSLGSPRDGRWLLPAPTLPWQEPGHWKQLFSYLFIQKQIKSFNLFVPVFVPLRSAGMPLSDSPWATCPGSDYGEGDKMPWSVDLGHKLGTVAGTLSSVMVQMAWITNTWVGKISCTKRGGKRWQKYKTSLYAVLFSSCTLWLEPSLLCFIKICIIYTYHTFLLKLYFFS